MTESATPTNATEARAVLDARLADKDWGARLLNGDVAAKRELDDLHVKITAGGDDVVASVFSGSALVNKNPNGLGLPSEIREMAVAVEHFRELGIADGIAEQFLRGERVSKEEYAKVEAWKRTVMSSKDFVDRFMSGDLEARQKMTIANSVLVNGVKESA